ncbi:unnamed protein product [Arctia plantaginis]|uniref:DUF7869 domain-containing protein n=1 Tax=Arctia plantaginis TaxID=874455 RepID=A0A8S1BDR3_ARCPL|nr:unnamed protein product [Arctia plantaginis]
MKKNSRIAKILQNVPTDPEIKTGCCTLQNNNVLVLDKPQNIIIKSDRSLQQSSTHQNPTSGISILFDSDLQSILPECDTLNNIATATIVTEIIHPDNIPAMNSLIQIPSHMESVEQASTLMPTTVLMNLAEKHTDNENIADEVTSRQGTTSHQEEWATNENMESDTQNEIATVTSTEIVQLVDSFIPMSSDGHIESAEQASTLSTEKPRKRQKKSQPQEWNANKNKEQREKGKAYLGKKKIENKWGFVEPKLDRKMKARCKCKLSLKGDTKINCDKISEEERQKIFDKFWNITWKEKKMFVKMSSICKSKERERCAGNSRRQNSVELYLTNSEGIRYRVCKTMFLNSLCVGEWVIKKWIIQDDLPKDVPKNNTKDEAKMQLRKFFDAIPKLESHYCRKNSLKLYLEPMWTSKTQLYGTYRKEFCVREKIEPLSVTTFYNMFEALNLSLYRPKKDLCDICESYKTGNVSEIDYKIHRDKKEEARNELAKDTASEHEVLTMDLQSVLLSPRSNVSSLYYKTKLIVHNFTVFDCKRNKGYCYIWNESEGKLTSNEFSTVIIEAIEKFITQNPLESNQEIIIYSDGCTYQNRNSVLSNALLNYSMEKKVTVKQKFLEKGHTQMECDSMHSVIERAIKNKKINIPADYVYIAKTACKKNPYDVQYLYHHFFKDVENTLKFHKSIRPGKRAGDPTVTNLRALKYTPDGKIVYKLRHSATHWQELPTRIKNITFIPWDTIPQLYPARLKIKKEKYQDLQALKHTMEKDYHNFYDNLPHF